MLRTKKSFEKYSDLAEFETYHAYKDADLILVIKNNFFRLC